MLHALPIFALVAFSAAVAGVDWRLREIPNRLNLAGFALGASLNLCVALLSMGVRGAGFALLNISLGVIVGGGIAIALWRVGAFGGGDVKFLAAVGAYVGPLFTLQLTAYSLLLFVLTSLLVFARNKRLSSALSASVAFMFKQRRERAEPLPAFELVPFGPAAFVGVCITALGTLNS